MKPAIAMASILLLTTLAGCMGSPPSDRQDAGSRTSPEGGGGAAPAESSLTFGALPPDAPRAFPNYEEAASCLLELPDADALENVDQIEFSKTLWGSHRLADAVQAVRDFINKVRNFSFIEAAIEIRDRFLEVVAFLRLDHKQAAMDYLSTLDYDASAFLVCHEDDSGGLVCDQRLMDVGTTTQVDVDNDASTGVDGKDIRLAVGTLASSTDGGQVRVFLDVQALVPDSAALESKIGIGFRFPDSDVVVVMGFSGAQDQLQESQNLTLTMTPGPSPGTVVMVAGVNHSQDGSPSNVVLDLFRVNSGGTTPVAPLAGALWHMDPAPRAAQMTWTATGLDGVQPMTGSYSWTSSETMTQQWFEMTGYVDEQRRIAARLGGTDVPRHGNQTLSTLPLTLHYDASDDLATFAGSIEVLDSAGRVTAAMSAAISHGNKEFTITATNEPFDVAIDSNERIDGVRASVWFDRGGPASYSASFDWQGVPKSAWLGTTHSDDGNTIGAFVESVDSIDIVRLDLAWNVGDVVDRKLWLNAENVPGAAYVNATLGQGLVTTVETARGLDALQLFSRFALANSTGYVLDANLTGVPKTLTLSVMIDPIELSYVASDVIDNITYAFTLERPLESEITQRLQLGAGPRELLLRFEDGVLTTRYDGTGAKETMEYLFDAKAAGATLVKAHYMIGGLPRLVETKASVDGFEGFVEKHPDSIGVALVFELVVAGQVNVMAEARASGAFHRADFHVRAHDMQLNYKAPPGDDVVQAMLAIRMPVPKSSSNSGASSSGAGGSASGAGSSPNIPPLELAYDILVEGGPVDVTIGLVDRQPIFNYELTEKRDTLELRLFTYLAEKPFFGGHVLFDGVPKYADFGFANGVARVHYERSEWLDDVFMLAEFYEAGTLVFRGIINADEVPSAATLEAHFPKGNVSYQATGWTGRMSLQFDRGAGVERQSYYVILVDVPRAFTWDVGLSRNVNTKVLTLASESWSDDRLGRGIARFQNAAGLVEVDLSLAPKTTSAVLKLSRESKSLAWNAYRDIGSSLTYRYYLGFSEDALVQATACDLAKSFSLRAVRSDDKFLPEVFVDAADNQVDFTGHLNPLAWSQSSAEGNVDLVVVNAGKRIAPQRAAAAAGSQVVEWWQQSQFGWHGNQGQEDGLLSSPSRWQLVSEPATQYVGFQANAHWHEKKVVEGKFSIDNAQTKRPLLRTTLDAELELDATFQALRLVARNVESIAIRPGMVTHVAGNFDSVRIDGPSGSGSLRSSMAVSGYAQWGQHPPNTFPLGNYPEVDKGPISFGPIGWLLVDEEARTVAPTLRYDEIDRGPAEDCRAEIRITATPSVDPARDPSHIGTTRSSSYWLLDLNLGARAERWIAAFSPNTSGQLQARFFDDCTNAGSNLQETAYKPIPI